MTIYQFVIKHEDDIYDKYIQAPTLEEAKTIILDQMIDEEVDLDFIDFLHVGIPCNDILRKLSNRIKD